MAASTVVADDRDRVGQQRHLAGTLDRHRHLVLVLCAVARDAPRLDLAAVGHELAQAGRILVVDVGAVLLAELAVLALRLASVVSHVLYRLLPLVP
jgi:hypothetical protein